MDPQLITAPGRIDIYVRGRRFTSYETGGSVPGFTALYADGLRSLTQPDAQRGKGLWISHGNVNGVAFGAEGSSRRRTGRIVTSDLVARRGSQSVGFRHECAWIADDGERLLREVRKVRAAHGTSYGAALDIGLMLTAPPETMVTLGRSEDALLSARVAAPLFPAGGGQLRNSNDEFGHQAIHGRQASWCACNGVVNGQTVGLALLDHPGNPWHPPPWLCHEDGLLSPSPFAWRDFTLAPGASLKLQYRIIVHTGYVEAGWVQVRLADWLRE